MSTHILPPGGSFFRGHHTPVILQTEAAECGLACLAMIAGHYGHRFDMLSLRNYYGVSLKGMTLHDVVRLAHKLKLSTRAVKAEMSDLGRLRLPCLLHWDHNHFVVLAGVGKRRVTIHDPAIGQRTMPLEEVSRHFTGIAMEAWPIHGFERKTEQARIKIFDLVRHTNGAFRAGWQILAMSLFLEALVITTPLAFQIVLDEAIVLNDRDLLVIVALGLGLALGFRALIDFIRSWSIMSAGATLTLQWKMTLFRHLLHLPLSFFERRHVGDLASRFGSLDTIQQALSTETISAIVDGVMSLALLAMMWLYNPLLAMFAIGVMLIYAIIRAIAYHLYRRANEQLIVYSARENTHFLETLRGMPSIKALVIGDRRQSTWSNYLADKVGADLHVQRLDLVFKTANTILFGVDRIAIVYFGATAVLSGSLTIGMLVAFLAYKDQFSARIAKLLDTAVKLQLLELHSERVADIALAAPEAEADTAYTPYFRANAGRMVPLSAHGISFRYGENEPVVINDFSIDIEAGECVAIVGPSGAGKTTLLKILAGLLRPSKGMLLLDGIPVAAMGMEQYRAQIGCVLQDDRLFAGSIAENIAAFDPSPSPDHIQHAAQLASIHQEVLRMPMGYETLVGDMGSSLSGGQLQRVVLARALYRSPRILLLDEATAHLDEDNERVINNAIRSLPISRIIVAHRRSTIDMADRAVPIWPAAAKSPGVTRAS
jgi:ATP-binding cassette, subfamily B, bacterial CvaB/MchF/RaxB